MHLKRSFFCAVLTAALLMMAGCGGSAVSPAQTPAETPEETAEPTPEPTPEELPETAAPDPEGTLTGLHHAEITVEGYGVIRLALDADTAPVTVANFIRLAESGFYDCLTFHRIIDGFMIQGGDPNHDGTGGASEHIAGEFAANGWENNISHVKGVISMARAGRDNPYTGVKANDSASSQFFITVADATYLDGQYAAFGWVTEGMDIVERIAGDAKPIDNNGTVLFEDQPVITSMVITD